jgi:hypothetical protein
MLETATSSGKDLNFCSDFTEEICRAIKKSNIITGKIFHHKKRRQFRVLSLKHSRISISLSMENVREEVIRGEYKKRSTFFFLLAYSAESIIIIDRVDVDAKERRMKMND